MGKKRKQPTDKRKPVNVRPIERKHSGKVVEPYRVMESLIEEHHPDLEAATILLCYRKGWKPDVDGMLTVARMKKASDLDRAIGSRFGDSYDFVMQINEEVWPGLDDQKKRLVMDHELCHGKPDLDRDGQQKRDERDRLCWRLRKHPIQEFHEILARYGIETVLEIQGAVSEAAANASMPLFSQPTSNGDGEAGDWLNASVDALTERNAKIATRHLDALRAAGIETLSDLADRMDLRGTRWHCGIKGIGPETGQVIADALGEIRCGSQAAN